MAYLPLFAVLLWLSLLSGLFLLWLSSKSRLESLEAWQKSVGLSFALVEESVKRFDIETYKKFHLKVADLESLHRNSEDGLKLLQSTVDKLIARSGAEASATARRAAKEAKEAPEQPSDPFSLAKSLALSLGSSEAEAQLWAMQVVNPQPEEQPQQTAPRKKAWATPR